MNVSRVIGSLPVDDGEQLKVYHTGYMEQFLSMNFELKVYLQTNKCL